MRCHGTGHGIGGYARRGEVPDCKNVARDIHERAMQSYEQVKKMNLSWTPLIDRMDNAANRMYGVPPAVHCIVDIDGRIAVHQSGKKPYPVDILKMLAENNGRLPGSKPDPVKPHPGYPAGWHTATISSRDGFHNLLAFYHKQRRWKDALQLMGQHRHHLVRQKPSLILYALEVLTDAAKEGKGDPAWIRLLAKHIRSKDPDAEMSARLQVLSKKLDKLTRAGVRRVDANQELKVTR